MGKHKNKNHFRQTTGNAAISNPATDNISKEKTVDEKSLAEVVPIEAPPTAPEVPQWIKDAQVQKKVERVYISNDDQYYFGTGTHYDIYKKLGAHRSVENGVEGVYFSVWAPHARTVSLVGDFNEWDSSRNVMERLEPLGIWQIFIPGIKSGTLYKFCIEKRNGGVVYKADPFAQYAELRPGTASRVYFTDFDWSDTKWMSEREQKDVNRQPLATPFITEF